MIGFGDLQEQSHAVFGWAVQTGAMVSLLIVIVLIIRRPFAKLFGARVAYALWALPVMRLFMPTVPIPRDWEFWSFDDALILSAPIETLPPMLSGTLDIAVVTAPNAAINWPMLVIMMWILGGMAWLGWQASLYRSARRNLMLGSGSACAQTLALSRECAATAGLKTLPDIRLAHDNRGPMVMGLLRPIVILPRGFKTDFTQGQQRFALMHELAHIKRRDLWAAFGALIFRAVNWPNPLVHYAMRAFRSDQEAACDASVLERVGGANARQCYGETLLRAATLNTQKGQAFTDVPIGLTLNHPLKERLMALRNPMKKMNGLTYTVAAAAILAGCAMTAPYTVASAQDDVLAGGYSVRKTESNGVHKIVVREDDGTILLDETYEIKSDDDGVRAWKIDSTTGKKTLLDSKSLNDIPGLTMTREPNGQVYVKADRIVHVPALPSVPHPPIAPIITIDKSGDGSVTVVTQDGKQHVYSSHGEMTAHMEGQEIIRIEMDRARMDMDVSRAQLSAARSLLEQMNNNDLPEARREIEKARAALKKAEKALENARK